MEVTAQRDEALDLLESARRENARLNAELERARSYKALYAAAHHVRVFFGCVVRGLDSRRMCVDPCGRM